MKKIDSSIFITYKKQIQDAIEDLKTKGKRHRQIPNLLTFMRLTAPCFIIPAAIVGNVPIILGLASFFSLTDLADGFIARNWNLTSELGATLDAVTDKVFASTLLLAASFANPILLFNLGLECGIAGINVYKKINNIPVHSSITGKIKTWFLFALAGEGIISPNLNIVNISKVLMTTTTVMQVFTIVSYLLPTLNKHKVEEIIKEDSNSSITLDVDDLNQKEMKKEKELEADTSSLKTQSEILRELKKLKDFLESERTFLENDDNKLIDSNNYQKSKKDDLKRN